MKFLSNWFDFLIEKVKLIFLTACWCVFLYFAWLVVLGLLQSHGWTSGWSVFSLLFDTLPWYGELLFIVCLPILAGVVVGLTLFVLYELFFGAKK